MVDALEAGEQHLALVHRRVELAVAVDVRVDDQIGRLRHDDLVVDDRNPQRRDEPRLLHERVNLVGLAVAVGVLQDEDAIAFGLAAVVGTIANAFGDPDAPVLVDVDVRRVMQHRRRRPQRDLESVRKMEELERNPDRLRRLLRRRLRRRQQQKDQRQRGEEQ